MPPHGLDEDERARARKDLRNALGVEAERKASDAFCEAFVRTGARAAMLEAFPSAPPAMRAVVELAPPEPAPQVPTEVPPDVAEQVREILVHVAPEVHQSEKALLLLVRQAAIRAERDAFYRSAGAVRDEIERAAWTATHPALHARPVGITSGSVQACWLNRTIRAETAPGALAVVAADATVQRLDIPRPLQPDAIEIDVMLRAGATQRDVLGLTGSGVTVGVIDSEVALQHPALLGRVVHRRNYTREPFGLPAAHGTAVAGIVAGDAAGYKGMAPGATVYNYKVLAGSAELSGDDFGGSLAIQHALEDGVRIVNCSWGAGPAGDGTSREAIACDTAWRLGLTIVKSAGNRGPAEQTLTTPADASGVLVVGAVDADATALQDYSSRGPTPGGVHRPHVLAPGGSFENELHGLLAGGAIGEIGVGTSFAAPHVAGLLALLLEREPELTPDRQRDRVIAACQPLAGLSEDEQGAGVVDVEGVLVSQA